MAGSLKMAMATLAILLLTTAAVHAGLLEELERMGANSPAHENTPVKLAKAVAPQKFTASGAVNETLADGACTGSLAATEGSCTSSSSACLAVTIAGPLQTTGALAKSNFSGCITLDNSPVQTSDMTLQTCFVGLGTGTITAGTTSATISMSGLMCASDAEPVASPTEETFIINYAYQVENGTGKLAGTAGAGNIASSVVIPFPIGTPPISAMGEVNFQGTI
jgi:hypothetical protein